MRPAVLDLFGLLPGVAAGDQVVGVPGERRTGARHLPGTTAVRYRTPAASSSPCNAMFNNKGEITPPCGSLPGGREPFPGLEHPGFQPTGEHPSCGEVTNGFSR